MKKSMLILTLLSVSLGAFAQAKVAFRNDSLHLAYFNPDSMWLNPKDAALAGTAYDGRVLGDGETLVADLFAGSSMSSLSLVASGATFGPGAMPGAWNLQLVRLPTNLPGGVPTYFQVQIHDSRDSSLWDSVMQDGHYYGMSPIFTAVPSTGIAYASLTQMTDPVDSTWFSGTFPLDDVQPGATGAIVLQVSIPEPSALALAGLGVLLLAGRKAGVLNRNDSLQQKQTKQTKQTKPRAGAAFEL